MNTLLDNLFARRPKIHYCAPPICGVTFVPTSSGAPAVSFEIVNPLNCVAYRLEGDVLKWDPYPGAICYNVYWSPDDAPPLPPVPPVPPVDKDFYDTVPVVLTLGEIGFFAYAPLGIADLTISFTTIIPGIAFYGVTDLVTVSLPNLVDITIGGLVFQGSPLLTSVSLPVFVPRNGMTIDISGGALDVTSVDGVLARCVANAAFVSGTVNLSGGTNAAPTGTDKATLIGRGVTVTTN